MKRSISRVISLALAAALTAAMSVAAMADCTTGGCKQCDSEGLTFTGLYATAEYAKISETQHAQYFVCNNGHKQLRYTSDGQFRDVSSHVASKNATCTHSGLTAGSHCGRPGCGEVLVPQTVVEQLPHTFDKGVVTSPTCFREGYTTYTCTVCKTQVITDKVAPLSHWYAEWTPAGKWMNSAPCKRPGCTHTKTTDCAKWEFLLNVEGEEKPVQYTVCPVCGQTSDDTRLEMVNNVVTKPITGWTPEGDLLFRQGELKNGEKIICVSFEFDARLAQDTGKTNFTVPASLLDGYKVMLLDADGNETQLDVDVSGTRATFQLDFGTVVDGHRIPVRMLHLVPTV